MVQAQEGLIGQQGYQLEKLGIEDGGLYAGHDDIMKVQSDGTTIISLKYNGGILLGADARSSNVSWFIKWICLCLIMRELLTMFFVTQDMYVGDRLSDKLEPIHHRIYCQR